MNHGAGLEQARSNTAKKFNLIKKKNPKAVIDPSFKQIQLL